MREVRFKRKEKGSKGVQFQDWILVHQFVSLDQFVLPDEGCRVRPIH